MTVITPLRKDTPREELQQIGAAAKPSADDYRRLLVSHRRIQLARTADNMQRLSLTYDRATQIILASIERLPDGVARVGSAWVDARLRMIRALREEIDRFARDYTGVLDVSMLESAQNAANREAEVARLVGAPVENRLVPTFSRTYAVSSEIVAAVDFGALAREAVETVSSRYYRDGLKLSERLGKLRTETLTSIEDAVTSGLAGGESARDLGKRIRVLLTAENSDTPGYRAMRIARTEVNNAFRESHTRSTMDAGGNLKSYISGIRWNLSLSHARSGPDICDLYAAHETGLGPGVYLPDDVPVDHPSGLCFPTTELKELPGAIPRTMTMKPDVDAVPESQIRYYAERLGDVPAQAALLARGGG